MADEKQIEFYDNFVDHFDEQKNNTRNKAFRVWTQKWVPKGSRVLDFGCALGYNSGYLAEQMNCEVTGIDISPKCISTAQNRYPESNWICQDITEKPLSEGLFRKGNLASFVLMSDVIEHVPIDRHDKLFSFISEVTDPGAAILASVPNPEFHQTAVEQTPQPVEERINVPELLGLMGNKGFDRIISVFLAKGNVYYRMVVQKSN